MPDYRMIPVDEDTDQMIVALCEAYEFGKRAKGAMVRKLVRAEYEKLAVVKLVPVRNTLTNKAKSKTAPKAE